MLKINLGREDWDLIIKALGKVTYTDDDGGKPIDETDAGKAEILAERIDIEFCKVYN